MTEAREEDASVPVAERIEGMDEKPRRGRRPAQGEPVLNRAFRLLDVFSVDEPVLTLTEISERCGIPLSSTQRLSQQLLALGVLERLPDGGFSMGLRMLGYAACAPRGHGLRALAVPYLEILYRLTQQHAQLAVADGEKLTISERLTAPNAVPARFHIGDRLPLHHSASGLAMLAYSGEEAIDAYVSGPLDGEPGSTALTDGAELRAYLAEVRKTGRAWFSRSIPAPGESIAAPIFDHTGACIAALGVVGGLGTINIPVVEPALLSLARVLTRDVSRARITSAT